MIQCKNCGYLVMNEMHTCPNCLAEMPEVEVSTPIMNDAVTSDYSADEIPYCTLRPLTMPGERPMPEVVYEEGEEVTLARENTLPTDCTIDAEEQACLFFSDGYWFIEDRSVDNSTFVHAGAGIKLESGDIVKMGNREFEFKIKTRKK